jgi:hypothetical protein
MHRSCWTVVSIPSSSVEQLARVVPAYKAVVAPLRLIAVEAGMNYRTAQRIVEAGAGHGRLQASAGRRFAFPL